MDAFDTALDAVLREEGGYSDQAADPGGITNCGVTKAVWDQWCGHTSTVAEMKALTPEKVAPLYRAQYWNAVQGDALPPALALCVFDFAVNAGVGRAARMLQEMIGVIEDGHIGPATLRALQQWVASHSVSVCMRGYMNARRAYYRSLSNFAHFGAGWLNRCDFIETQALRLVR